MKLTNKNYYSNEANFEYLSVSQYKDFCGSIGKRGCEAHALAKLKGEWKDETTTPMLVGSYVDSYIEGTLEEFKEQNPLIFKKDGTLKAEYIQAESIIERIEKDKLFMEHLSGEKQVIMTGELFGAKWKIKIDSYIKNKVIVDLKIIKDINERFWVKDFGFTNFIEYWGYDLQLAIYQEIARQNTGNKLPCVIAVADKQKSSNIELIKIPQWLMDDCISDSEANVKRIIDLKTGNAEPTRCEKCDFCKETKILKGYLPFDKIIEI